MHTEAEVLVCKSAKNILPKFLVCHFFQMAARILRLPLVKNICWPIIERWRYMISQVSDNNTADLIKLSLKKKLIKNTLSKMQRMNE